MKKEHTDQSRRTFIKALGVAGGVAVVAASAEAVAEAPAEEASTQSAPDKGYRETEHVRAYYRSARV